jgi:hypothetical protein
MPHYTIENTETGDEFDIEMCIADKEAYLKANPHLRQVLHTIRVADSMIRAKPPSDFQNGILKRMADSIPGNNIREQSKFGFSKEY